MTNKDAWKKLTEVFRPNPTPSDEMYRAFIKATEKFSPLAIVDAYSHAVEHETRFPSIALFRNYCDVFQEKIDDEKHEKRKRAEEIAAKHGNIFGEDKLAKQVQAIVRRLLSGDLTRRGYLDALNEIGINPGLDSWYKKQGYNLDEPCRMAKMGRKIWSQSTASSL